MRIKKYAFYRETSNDTFGNPTYAGPFDGLERKYFGTDLDQALKMLAAARKANRHYKLYELEYGIPGRNTAKERILYASPRAKKAKA